MTQLHASIHHRRSSGFKKRNPLQTDAFPGAGLHEGLPARAGKNRNRRSGGRHVLLVQRRTLELQVIAQMLGVLGYQVTSTEDCGKALLYFGREHCEVVISELDMPGFNGFQLARCIRRHSPRTRIMLMTACCQAEVVNYMDRKVVDGWLFKPFRMEELKDMLKSLLDSEKEEGWTTLEAVPMALNNWWSNGALNSAARKTRTITRRPIIKRPNGNLLNTD